MNRPEHTAFRPVPGDAGADAILRFFDTRPDAWVLTRPGDYAAAAAEAFGDDGSGYERVVILQWPGRLNHGSEEVTVRLMIAPEDALGLADVLIHSATWLQQLETPQEHAP